MPACWVANPIVQVDGVNMPLVETLLDGGGRQRFHHASVIYPERGMAWCLSYVTTQEPDFSGLDAVVSIVRIFDEVLTDETDGQNPLPARVQTWMKEQHQTNLGMLRGRLSDKGANRDGINNQTTRMEVIKRLGLAAAAVDTDFNPSAWHTPGGKARP